MIEFRQRLSIAIANSGAYKDNIWQLARDAGLGDKTLYNILRDERLDNSKTGPGIFGMARVAAKLGVSLDDLTGLKPDVDNVETQSRKVIEHLLVSVASSSNAPISADRLLRTYKESGGRIEAFEDLMESCDQYRIPEPVDQWPRVLSVGKRSLSAITMKAASAELLEESLRDMEDRTLLAQTLADYRFAAERGSMASLESRDIEMPSKPIRVKMDFLRILLAVHDAKGDRSLLLFALLVN